jgi:amidase
MTEELPQFRPFGKIRRPTREKLRELAAQDYMALTDQEIDGISLIIGSMLNAVDKLDTIVEPERSPKYNDRDPGRRPLPGEDPFNAFITKCHVKGANNGPLKGKTVGLKDNISLRGVPMTNASRLGEFYIPDVDATIVTKLLDAGATIVGKLNMDEFSFSGTSETSFFGSVRNPINPEYSAGGSSSGSGAAVASGAVDIAIGVDQGGSARTPASVCGVVCIKPTHGLVSSYGSMYMDFTIDHLCPIARSVEEVALALQVIAGEDENDPEWFRGSIPIIQYYDELAHSDLGIKNLKIGTIAESLAWEGSDPQILEAFSGAIKKLTELGASSTTLSIPTIQFTPSIRMSTLAHATSAMIDSCGEGYWRGGRYNPAWNAFFGRSVKAMADQLPPLLKSTIVLGRYLRSEYFSVYNSKAHNIQNWLQKEVERALEKVDVLACPTNVVKPPKLKETIKFDEVVQRGFMLNNNTQPFNMTGHPAITIPVATRGGFPVGLQLVSKYFGEADLFRVARVYEKNFSWRDI